MTHQRPMLGHNTMPNSSGNVFFEPYPIKATNDFWRHGHWIFNDTSIDDKLYGMFTVPHNYVGTAQLVILWTTTAISGNANFEFAYRDVAGNDAESLDQATAEETVTSGAIAAPGAANRRMETVVNLVSANFAPGSSVPFYFARKGTSLDTIAAALALASLEFRYSDAA